MMVRILLFVCMTVVLLAGCARQGDDTDAPTGPGPLGATPSTGYLRASIGPYDFRCNTTKDMATETAPRFQLRPGSPKPLSVSLIGEHYAPKPTPVISVYLIAAVDTTSGTSYSIGTSRPDAGLLQVSIDGKGLFVSDDKSPVTVVIDRIDTSAGSVKGHFSGTLYNKDLGSSMRTVDIRNGTFEVGY